MNSSLQTMDTNLDKNRKDNIVTVHGYFERLIFQYASFNNSRSLHFCLKLWPVVCIWFTNLDFSTMAFNLNNLNFNRYIVDSQGRILNTWADIQILNRIDLRMEVHERNAYNLPLNIAPFLIASD